MAYSVEALTKKMQEVKINDDCFFGNDLSYQKEFLEKIENKIEQDIPDSEISYFLKKMSMYLHFEIPKVSEKIAKGLLFKTDWLMDEYFLKKEWVTRVTLVL